ncbi:immunity protein YezG family protein [Mycobacteroides abscessus]|uniref:immunity protein YezG family protein n=1 Tax=Mycobacteroides abscessus TaxID=36809 RepID=UPI000C2694FB|nr:immunity protein YezG family protein [Mycobacteroides abscessus]RIR68068.1 DUF600 family protein [Mycobacteroides abscessus]
MTAFDAARQAQERIAKVVYSDLESKLPGWSTAALEYMEASARGSAGLEAKLASGEVKSVKVNSQVFQPLRELRRVMATAEHGTWLSMVLAVTSSGEFSYEFNYDQKPDWDPEPTSDAFIEDLENYPRPESEVPGWYPRRG